MLFFIGGKWANTLLIKRPVQEWFFFTDNENHNKDAKPPWCDFFLDSEVQPNQKLHSVRGLQKLNGKLNYTSLY